MNDMEEFNNKIGKANDEKVRVSSPSDAPQEIARVNDDINTNHFTGNTTMWSVADGNYIPCQKAVDILPPGQYTVNYSSSIGFFFSEKKVMHDKLMELPDTAAEKVIQSVEHFWTREKYFRKFDSIWKRGILLWGPPGSGKSSVVQILSHKLNNIGGISIYADDPRATAEGLHVFRRIEPTRPIIMILEDVDAIIDRYGESNLLALLDGELQIDNIVYVATTNYPERLDQRFVNRPSRFDIIKKIGMPSSAARKMFLENKNPRLKRNNAELEKWVKVSEGYSVAHLKEMVISIECLGNSFEETVDRLNAMMNKKLSSSSSGSIGFNTQADYD